MLPPLVLRSSVTGSHVNSILILLGLPAGVVKKGLLILLVMEEPPLPTYPGEAAFFLVDCFEMGANVYSCCLLVLCGVCFYFYEYCFLARFI